MPHIRTVHLSESAFMHLCLAGLESYLVREEPLETYGLLWGNVVETEDEDNEYRDYRVDHVTVDIDAERGEAEVAPNDRNLEVKRQMVNAFWPHVSFLGNFHTHPYEHYKNDRVVHNRYFVFSEHDRCFVEHHAEYWCDMGLEIALVLTIAGMDIPGWRAPRRMPNNSNAIEWTMDRYRVWLAAYSVERADDAPELLLHPCEQDWNRDAEGGEYEVQLYVPSVLGLHLHDRLNLEGLQEE